MTRKHYSQTNDADMLKEVSNYYAEKLSKHGSSAQGVDWNSETSQTKRFEQLCKVIDLKSGFSINDFGCGYGALFSFLAETFDGFEYFGNDVSKEMISAANLRYSENPRAHFQVSSGLSQAADFTVASGIFNVRLSNSDQDWDVYIE
jgi:cyclopropane fatty-acyl-phospholipid synthase-like methyltransferase